MADKKYLETFTSPAGEAVFPWVTKADVKHDASGVYHTDLSMPPELAADFIEKLEGVRAKFAEEELSVAQKQSLVARPVFRDEYTYPEYPDGASDEEKAAIKKAFVPEPTGNILFRFKMKAKVFPKNGEPFEQAPVVVMADTGEKCEEPVYTGSILRVRGQIVPYSNAAAGAYGVTLRMKAVQVIELVTGEGQSASHWTDFDND